MARVQLSGGAAREDRQNHPAKIEAENARATRTAQEARSKPD